MQLNIKEQQILQYAMEHGIIDLTDVSADVEKMKKQEILKKYHYWQGSDGRFYFKYRDSESGRKKKNQPGIGRSYSGSYFEVPRRNSRKAYTGHCFR